MSELHVRQIKAALTQHFDGLIDMSDYEVKPASERESAFLSRSQAAFVLTYLTGETPAELALRLPMVRKTTALTQSITIPEKELSMSRRASGRAVAAVASRGPTRRNFSRASATSSTHAGIVLTTRSRAWRPT